MDVVVGSTPTSLRSRGGLREDLRVMVRSFVLVGLSMVGLRVEEEEGFCMALGMRGRVKGPLIWTEAGGAMKSGWRRRGRESRVER